MLNQIKMKKMKNKPLLWLGLLGSMVCAANHLYITHNHAAALPWALVVIFQVRDIIYSN